ncbi:MAG: hypothetical protein NG712_04425 [Omnitrophica bacterium]|nr:hypothetical protein [Candidatus Omnitrophota bacterium]
MDIKKILSLPPAERDDEIWKLLYPIQWKSVKANCSLDWNRAMKMRDETQHMKFNIALRKVFNCVVEVGDYPCGLNYGIWVATKAQPHHYILAAILAGGEEAEDE